MRGSAAVLAAGVAMSEILTSVKIGKGKAIHVGSLSKSTIEEAAAQHLGCEGYFVFETDDNALSRGIEVLGKTTCFDSALRLADLIVAAQTRQRRRRAANTLSTGG